MALKPDNLQLVIEAFSKRLKHSDAQMRKQAAESFGKMGNESIIAIPGLLKALEDSDEYVRMSAAEALGKIGSETAIPGLLKALEDSNKDVRRKAAEALGNIGSETAIPLLCQALEAENDLDVQSSIMDAIVLINNLTSETPMSENTQGSKYNIVQPQNVQIIEQGDGIIHNYATPQNLAEAAQEIQQLISQITQTYSTNTEIEKQTFVAQVDAEIKKNSRLRSILIPGGIELIKVLCPPLGIPVEMGKKWLETASLSE